MDVADAGGQAPSQIPFEAGAERPGARQLQIAISNLYVRQERRRARAVDLLVDGGDGTERSVGAAAEEGLLERAVGRAVLGEDEHRNARDVGTGIGAQHGAPVAGEVPGESGARLQVVQVVRDPAIGREAGIVEIRREEGVGRIDEYRRMPRAIPAQPQVQRHALVRMPGVLHEQAQFVRLELLPSELVGRHAGHGRGLQVQEYRTTDLCAGRTDPECVR